MLTGSSEYSLSCYAPEQHLLVNMKSFGLGITKRVLPKGCYSQLSGSSEYATLQELAHLYPNMVKVIKLIPVKQDVEVRTIPVDTGHGKQLDKSGKSHSKSTYLFTKMATFVPLTLEAHHLPQGTICI